MVLNASQQTIRTLQVAVGSKTTQQWGRCLCVNFRASG